MTGLPKILFIGAHNDDCEYGAGGVAAMLNELGCETVFLNIACTRHADFDEKTLKKMNKQETDAAAVLGASKIITGERSKETYFYTQQNVDIIEEQLHKIKADIVFIHWHEDNHIEHVSAAKCTMDALCLADVHGYAPREVYAFEAGPNQTSVYFNPDFYVDIGGVMDRVKESLLVFNQHHANGKGLWIEKEVAARFRGHLAHKTYAEAFKIMNTLTATKITSCSSSSSCRENIAGAVGECIRMGGDTSSSCQLLVASGQQRSRERSPAKGINPCVVPRSQSPNGGLIMSKCGQDPAPIIIIWPCA